MQGRQYLKYTLSLTRIKVLYERVVLNRYTTAYSIASLLTCILLIVLHAITLSDNTEALRLLRSLLDASDDTKEGLAVVEKGKLELCTGLPTNSASICRDVVVFGRNTTRANPIGQPLNPRQASEDDSNADDEGSSGDEASSQSSSDLDDADDEDDDDDTFFSSSVLPTATTTPRTTFLVPASSTLGSTPTPVVRPPIATTIGVLESNRLSSTIQPVQATPSPTSPAAESDTSSSSEDEADGDDEGDSEDDDSAVSSTVTSVSAGQTFTTVIVVPATPSISTAASISDFISATTASPRPTSMAPSAPFSGLPSGALQVRDPCSVAIRWLDEAVHDNHREDVVSIVYQLWLFGISMFAIVTESIPHLAAGFLSHVLGTAWAFYRISSTQRLKAMYLNDIVPRACNNRDFMGDWWSRKVQHDIPIAVVGALSLLVFTFLCFKLFGVYTKQAFSRVGSSPRLNLMYKVVLLFSVCLQLAGFFSLASTTVWLDKVSRAPFAQIASHAKLYLAAFIVTLVLQLPWLVLGWMSVRRECNIRYIIFFVISIVLIAISSTMFFSNIYRYTFMTWPFFASLTVTSFVLLALTTIISIFCRLRFGQGVAEWLQATETLEASDFTTVYFPTQVKVNEDVEKFRGQDFDSDAREIPAFDYPIMPQPMHNGNVTEDPFSNAHAVENGGAGYLSPGYLSPNATVPHQPADRQPVSRFSATSVPSVRSTRTFNMEYKANANPFDDAVSVKEIAALGNLQVTNPSYPSPTASSFMSPNSGPSSRNHVNSFVARIHTVERGMDPAVTQDLNNFKQSENRF